MEPYTKWSFVTCFFHLASYLQGWPYGIMRKRFIPFYVPGLFQCMLILLLIHRMDMHLCTCLSVGGHSGCPTFWLLWIILLWTWIYSYLLETPFSVMLDIYPGVVLLDHKVILYLIIWGTTTIFCSGYIIYYIPTKSVQEFQFLHIFAHTCYFLLCCSSQP